MWDHLSIVPDRDWLTKLDHNLHDSYSSAGLNLTMLNPPIRFGTDGWRGVIADEFTFARLAAVVPVAATVLRETYSTAYNSSNTIVVGYDRRFLSETFAAHTAKAASQTGLNVLLADRFAPTPAFSWAAYDRKTVGALVITASHNPAAYSGLKLKGPFGGSVSPDLTAQVEAKLAALDETAPLDNVPLGQIQLFNPWESYCAALRTKVDINRIREAILAGKLTVFVDVMHGAAAGGLGEILGLTAADTAHLVELNGNADPLFGGGAPEPLPKYIGNLLQSVKDYQPQQSDGLVVGLVFDGDADRIAAVDSQGNFLSSQILIPILLQHLTVSRGYKGEFIKTISGSDLMPKVAALYDLPVYETPVGYKYIAERMLSQGDGAVLLGGEESGGIGYGTHIPERDALLSALYVLEAMITTGQDLSVMYEALQRETNFLAHYDRIDKHLPSMAARTKLEASLAQAPLTEIAGRKVINVTAPDGYKFYLADGSWLLVRFSGTEPLLRLYCEAPTPALVAETLEFISQWADQFD